MKNDRSMAAISYLDVDDEITLAAARIRDTRERRLGMVLPAGSRISTSRINFRLLAREAATRGCDLAIIAPEPATRALAAAAGLPAYGSVAAYEADLAASDDEPPEVEPAADDAALPQESGPDADDPLAGPSAGIVPATQATVAAWPADSDADPDAPSGGQLTGSWASDPSAPAVPAVPRETATRQDLRPRSTGAASDVREGSRIPVQRDVRARTSISDTLEMPIPDVEHAPARRRRSGLILLLVCILIVLLAAGGVAGWLFLPSATVTVTARVEPVGPLQFTVRADPLEVTEDMENGIVPAEVVTFDLDVSQEFPATGKKVTETKSGGSVRWTNCDPTATHTIQKATVVRTGDGVQFLTAASVFLPVATLTGNPPSITCQSREIAITARDPGTGGNVAAGKITVVPSDFNSVVIRVTNPAATTGGTHVESQVVTQKDVDAAMVVLGKAIREEFAAKLADPASTPEGRTLFAATRSMSSGDPTEDPESLVGMVQPKFTLGLVASGTATAVDESLVLSLGDQRIRAAVSTDQSLVQGSVEVKLGTPRADGSSVVYPVTARASEVNSPDAIAIRKLVKGLDIDEARERLRDYGDATVDVWPAWVTSIPTYDFRLQVRVVSDTPTEPVTPGPSSGSTDGSPGAPTGSPAAT